MPLPKLGKTTGEAGFLEGWREQGDQEFSLGHTMFGMSAREPSGGAEEADGD